MQLGAFASRARERERLRKVLDLLPRLAERAQQGGAQHERLRAADAPMLDRVTAVGYCLRAPAGFGACEGD
jgi:hypothetical protein